MNLLLIVGAAFFLLVVGTLLGRYYAPDRRPLERAAEEGRAYVRGLLEHLEGNDEQAIGEIAQALKRNTQTIDAYFALGTLFRRRGEYERAVRVHQAVLMRRDLDKQTRLRVHHQLALDFSAGGFPRRAVKALEWVVTKDPKQVGALQELARLYELTGEWDRAALIQHRIARVTGTDTSALQAHLLAELAAEALRREDLGAARRALKRALAASRDSVHALHLLALYQERKGNAAAACGAWEHALRAAPDLAGFFVPRLERALAPRGKPESLSRLMAELREKHPESLHLRLAWARLESKRNAESALQELSRLLGDAPNLVPAWREKARLVLERGEPEAVRRTFEEVLGLLAKADRGYRCAGCGHTAEELFWRCPSCAAWDRVTVAWGRRSGEGGGRPQPPQPEGRASV